MIAKDLRKQQAITADPKAIQQIIFTRNLSRTVTIVFIIAEAKETILNFLQETVRVLLIYFALI